MPFLYHGTSLVAETRSLCCQGSRWWCSTVVAACETHAVASRLMRLLYMYHRDCGLPNPRLAILRGTIPVHCHPDLIELLKPTWDVGQFDFGFLGYARGRLALSALAGTQHSLEGTSGTHSHKKPFT